MKKPRLYLLSGNGSITAWWDDCLPYFGHYQPVPLELPGSGNNRSPKYRSLDELADALLEDTEAGHPIFAVGINALVVLHALVRRPQHFSRVILLAPVGAFLWQRRFVKIMSLPPIRKTILYLLRHHPKIFARKFSSRRWTEAQYQRMGAGYQQSRSFEAYFEFTQARVALNLFEWIRTPVEIVWGKGDAVLGLRQAAAWEAILCRAELQITLHDHWEHYPYIDDPKHFAESLEARLRGHAWPEVAQSLRAHTKSGRLQLATLASLPVPPMLGLQAGFSQDKLETFLKNFPDDTLFAVRSSASGEDSAEQSQAGKYTTYIRVEKSQVPAKVKVLLATVEEVVVQKFVEARYSGVAFVRNISAEVEMVEGDLEQLVDGTSKPLRFILTKMNRPWHPSATPSVPDFPFSALQKFLNNCIAAFHYMPADIEWAWDGQSFFLLQTRPVTTYPWRRCLTSANIDELLPARVSRVMEHAQQKAALSISRAYSLWDTRSLEDAEPFTVTYEGASYINMDNFLSRFRDWGLPSQLIAREIGGTLPLVPFHLLHFLRSIPLFLRMLWKSRAHLPEVAKGLQQYRQELDHLEKIPDPQRREEYLVNWLTRFYVFIVQSNIIINAAISSAGGGWIGNRKTVYQDYGNNRSPHRLPYESDPATPREAGADVNLRPLPQWPATIKWLHRLGFPGLRAYYIEVREWFRDNNMRLFYRLHFALQESTWLEDHPHPRSRKGSFWQDGDEISGMGKGFVIYPGEAEGVLGEDILLLDTLKAGDYDRFAQAKAVIALSGGKLSHGATLLRELQKPSPIIPHANEFLPGQRVHYAQGILKATKEELRA